ncbi:MAG TPA: class I SAM-dependent methyltransferase [Pyrinomonadaceae bacterium]|nr:class I SAM-dependent methyltransferase [Pyrinomonadaceae bacterium]
MLVTDKIIEQQFVRDVAAQPLAVAATGDDTAPACDSLSLESVGCCVCDSDEALPVGVGEDFEYRTSRDTFVAMQCEGCGLVYLNPRPSVDEFSRIYPSNYHAFDFSPERYGFVYKVRRRLEARRALQWCRGLKEGGRIIDIGCGDGFHLGLLRDFGHSSWRAEGVDSDARAVEAASRAGLTAHVGSVERLDLPAASYDLALMIQTIEHVADPPAVLRAVLSLLRPGGKLVIVTDNTDSPDFRLFKGRHWGGYHFPRHWNLFNRRSLRALAGKVGFEVESLSTVVSPVNWVYSVRNLLADMRAPAWLVNQFSLEATASLAAATLFDSLHKLAGRGALLRAVLRRPAA